MHCVSFHNISTWFNDGFAPREAGKWLLQRTLLLNLAIEDGPFVNLNKKFLTLESNICMIRWIFCKFKHKILDTWVKYLYDIWSSYIKFNLTGTWIFAAGLQTIILMFSRVFRRNNKNEITEETNTTPDEPQVERINGSTTETSSSGSKKRTHARVDNIEILIKYKRFELNAEGSSKKWDLYSGLAVYLNKYWVNYISEKYAKQRTLIKNVVLSSLEACGFLKNTSKNLCSKTKRTIP